MNFTFVLDNVRSAFNVGSIFRTADGLQFDVDLIGITPIPGKDRKLEKTSLFSLEYVKWKYFNNSTSWYESIPRAKSVILSVEKTDKFKTISLFELKDIDFSCSKDKYIYIILGHEINGVSDFLLRNSDYIVQIPMFGKKNSLNVGTCAGIVGYHLRFLSFLPQ